MSICIVPSYSRSHSTNGETTTVTESQGSNHRNHPLLSPSSSLDDEQHLQ